MLHAEESITIHRPVPVVFAFLLDGMNNPLWRPGVVDIQRMPGTPEAVGARFTQRLKGPGGRRIAGDYEIVACQPNHLIQFQAIAGPARPTGSYRLEAVGEATRIVFSLDYEPQGLARLMGPMIARTMRSEVAMLSNLKAHLEAHT